MLEGVDKAGKTTQCKKLVHALQKNGRAAEMMRFPGNKLSQCFYSVYIYISMCILQEDSHTAIVSLTIINLYCVLRLQRAIMSTDSTKLDR